jgi:hypothetical protein
VTLSPSTAEMASTRRSPSNCNRCANLQPFQGEGQVTRENVRRNSGGIVYVAISAVISFHRDTGVVSHLLTATITRRTPASTANFRSERV